MNMCLFHWVNIFLPASAESHSVGSSLQKRAVSDLVWGCGPGTGGSGWAGSPFQLPQESYSLFTLLINLKKEIGLAA